MHLQSSPSSINACRSTVGNKSFHERACFHEDHQAQKKHRRINETTNDKTHRRCVKFNETANQVHEAATATSGFTNEDGTNELCYSHAEYKAFKINLIKLAKEMVRLDSDSKEDPLGYRSVMERLHRSCSAGENDDEHTEEDGQSHFSTIYQETSAVVVQAQIDRVGLERTTIRRLHQDRSTRRRDIVEVVLDIQEDYYYSAEERAEMIAMAARSISRPSRLFASRLAAILLHQQQGEQ